MELKQPELNKPCLEDKGNIVSKELANLFDTEKGLSILKEAEAGKR